DTAEALHQRALDLLEPAGDHTAVGVAYNGLAIIAYLRGDVDAAAKNFEHAAAAAERAGDVHQSTIVLGNLGVTRLASGRPDLAVDAHTRALAKARELGQTMNVQRNLINIAPALMQLDRIDDAEAALDEALELIGDEPSMNR